MFYYIILKITLKKYKITMIHFNNQPNFSFLLLFFFLLQKGIFSIKKIGIVLVIISISY